MTTYTTPDPLQIARGIAARTGAPEARVLAVLADNLRGKLEGKLEGGLSEGVRFHLTRDLQRVETALAASH